MATDITILDGTGDSAADGTNTFKGDVFATPGTILTTDNSPTSIFESELEGIGATTNISIAATASITINNFADNNLNLAQTAGNSVTFTAPTFTMADTADTITTAGGALTISASTAATIGGLNTNGGLITLDIGTTGAVSGIIARGEHRADESRRGHADVVGDEHLHRETTTGGVLLNRCGCANLGTAPGAATTDYLTFEAERSRPRKRSPLNANRGRTFNGAAAPSQRRLVRR